MSGLWLFWCDRSNGVGFWFLGGRFRGDFCVFLEAEFVGGLQGAEHYVFGGDGEIYVCGAAAAPAAGDGDEDFGEVFDECGLLFGSDHDVAVAEFRGGERGEDAAVDAEVGGTHMGAFFSAGEGEGETAEVVDVHEWASEGF